MKQTFYIPHTPVLKWLVLAAALGSLLPGLWQSYRVHGNSGLATVEATIQQIDTISSKHHRVYITYEYEGQTCRFIELGYWNRDMEVGDPVTIRLDPENPKNITTGSGNAMCIIMGLALGFIGLQMFLSEREEKTGGGKFFTNPGYDKTKD